MKKLITIFLLMFVSALSYAASISYCAHNAEPKATAAENAVLQKLIPRFAKEKGCDIGTNCLKKWNKKINYQSIEFSIFTIKLTKQCVSINFRDTATASDKGHRAVFICSEHGKTCCTPLDFGFLKEWTMCE
jgi:hypothetical protein